jgi:hypothetical protein
MQYNFCFKELMSSYEVGIEEIQNSLRVPSSPPEGAHG